MIAPQDVITRLPGEPEIAYQALVMLAAKNPSQRVLSDVALACGVSRVTPGRWRDRWGWEARIAAYDAAVADPITGPLTRAIAAADRPADPAARDELVEQIRAYRAQVLDSADAMQAVAMRALDAVRKRLEALTPEDIEDMSVRDVAALSSMALAAIKQAQASKGDIFGLTEFVTYLENGGREVQKPQVSHRSDDAEDK